MASKVVPLVRFNNGQLCPVLGLGTWQSKPGQVAQAVKDAIDIGYRHLDCAQLYGNETEIGTAIAAKISDGTVTRSDLFVTSKVWATSMHPDQTETAFKTSLRNLQLTYLDLYLLHTPTPIHEVTKARPMNGDDTFDCNETIDYMDTWRTLERFQSAGLAKSIGVSNFNRAQIERILTEGSVLPVTNQIECHPYLNQRKMMDFCRDKNIFVTGYSPLGSPDRPWAKPEDPIVLEDGKIKEMAGKYGKTPAQVLIKYQVQRGNITIPKSVTKSRIQENFDIWNFELTPEDIAYIDTFDCNGRFYTFYQVKKHKYYPFNDEY